MTPWDGNYILKRLKEFDLTPGDIQFVISTHGHSDHVGNNNLFLSARHIVGRCISYRTTYFDEPFSRGDEYVIDPESLRVISTPGHTLACVTVLVKTDEGLVAIAGDLFEKLEDVYNEYVWLGAGSENPDLQRHNRAKIIQLADYIIPGHGPRFKVTKEMKEKFKP
ncbi:Metallo-beta-lactamase superfamily [Nesidiocoris tenuis]|nr:Metallo-beta-lactamase superfamily [Nesidiocoris tenuis]